jgi:tRNA threonylcarbamoyladenosine biosynthesis protein TsaB
VEALLGFDTSTGETTVAIAAGADVLAERDAGPDEAGRPSHASQLLPAVEAVVAEAGGWERVRRIAVGVGPGTFTGLRIGIATARALAQACAVPVSGVSSLAALAAGAGAETARLAALDAKRGEVFAALFGLDGRELWPAWVGAPEELAARVAELPAPPLAVGDGSVRFRNELEAAGALVPAGDDPVHRLRARHVCRLGAEAPAQRPDEIEPNYLRRPDAELWRERDHRPPNGG